LTPIGITRREFLGATASAIVVPSAFGAPSAAVAQGFAYAYVGTYTPNGGGIYLFESDLSSGALTQLQVLDDIRNPSWLALNPAQTRLYAVSEIDNFDGQHNGAVASYSIDAVTLQLRRLGVVSSRGGTPAHLSVHPSGKFRVRRQLWRRQRRRTAGRGERALGEATDVRPSVGPRHRARAADDPPGQSRSATISVRTCTWSPLTPRGASSSSPTTRAST